MKKVSVQAVKRHKRPVDRVSDAGRKHLHQGSRFGGGNLKPFLNAKTKGRYLQVLAEDRDETSEER